MQLASLVCDLPAPDSAFDSAPDSARGSHVASGDCADRYGSASAVALRGSLAGDKGKQAVAGFAIDHRKVTAGSIFGAFEGAQANGEDYIEAAIAAGAIAVVARPSASVAADVLHIATPSPRRTFAHLAARFYAPYPPCCVAVTGTNGKSSVVDFLRQIWAQMGAGSAADSKVASLGTLGVQIASTVGAVERVGEGRAVTPPTTSDSVLSAPPAPPALISALTSPDIISFLSTMAALAREGVERVAFEASSHGLAQYRMAGLPIAAAAFTNLSRDHLDYHQNMQSYFEAKMLLFAELVDKQGTAIVWSDDSYSDQAMDIAKQRGLRLITVGRRGADIRLVRCTATAHGQELVLDIAGAQHAVALPLIGAFQAANALVAAGLAIASGCEKQAVLAALSHLQGVRGRLQRVAVTNAGVPIYVDYAHTPVALVALLDSLREHTGGRLILVFGAGGERDPDKREPMGQAAATRADIIIVTDDNPRGENPTAIRRTILSGVGSAVTGSVSESKSAECAPTIFDIGDRRAAIAKAISLARAGDVLCIAGKGHEQGQTIGTGDAAQVLAIDDSAVAQEIIEASLAENDS